MMASINLSVKDIDKHIICCLARSYNTLDYQRKLKVILNSVFPNEDFSHYNKFQLHQIINETLMNRYFGEEALKFYLFNEFVNKKVVAAFEIRANNSRVDFLMINGETKSFEIKSELDNLLKLKKQVSDYLKVFEYNYVVVHSIHLDKALSIVPENYGIWCYKRGRKKIVREAKLNTNLDCEYQLKLLNKKELVKGFAGLNYLDIIKEKSELEINQHFKILLKERYHSRWSFVVRNKAKILPMDLQFFFNKNINPDLIYQS